MLYDGEIISPIEVQENHYTLEFTIEAIYEHKGNACRSSDLVRTGLTTVRKYPSFICLDLPIEISLEKTSDIV